MLFSRFLLIIHKLTPKLQKNTLHLQFIFSILAILLRLRSALTSLFARVPVNYMFPFSLLFILLFAFCLKKLLSRVSSYPLIRTFRFHSNATQKHFLTLIVKDPQLEKKELSLPLIKP